jgi:hypothetical protein
LLEEVKAEFTRIILMPDINEWLNSDLPLDYSEKIKATCKTIPIREVREFWEGHTESFRHLRGGSFRRACVDFLLDIWYSTYKAGRNYCFFNC